MSNNFFRDVNKDITGEDIMMLSPLQLAYVGDAVYELLVRTSILRKELKVNHLHRYAKKYVNAEGQSKIIHHLEPILTETEKYYVRKGRNSKIHSSPKNASLIDYKYATGFECLLGYLYLTNQDERISQIFDSMMKLEI